MPKTPTAVVVHFKHDRLNYGEPRFALVPDEETAEQTLAGFATFFGEEPSASYGYSIQTPAEFLAQHPHLTGEELEAAFIYDPIQDDVDPWMQLLAEADAENRDEML